MPGFLQFIPSPLENISKDRPEQENPPTPTDYHKTTYRKGEYGYHQTLTGKIVYKRPKNMFTTTDLERISARLVVSPPEEENTTPDAWWLVIIQKLTIKMLGEILDKIPAAWALDIDAKTLYWDVFNLGKATLLVLEATLRKKGRYDILDTFEKLKAEQKGK